MSTGTVKAFLEEAQLHKDKISAVVFCTVNATDADNYLYKVS